MNRIRVLAAFVLSPLAPALIAGIWERSPDFTAIWALFSYPFALLLGVPAYLLFRRLGWLNPAAVLGGSLALGVLAFIAAHFVLGANSDIGSVLLFVGCAGLVGVVFCVIVFAGTSAIEPQSSN